MLSAVLRRGDLEDVGRAEQRLARVPVRDWLKDGKVFQDTVHHVLLGQVLQLEDEVDHVLAEGTSVDLVDVPPAL